METTPTMTERLRALARFAPIFAAPEFAFATWHQPEADSSGVPGFSYRALSPEASEFVQAAKEFGWVGSFNWDAWRNSDEGKQLLANPERVDTATAAQLLKLLTVFIRRERFQEGSLAAAFDAGFLTAVVKRADELRRMQRLLSDEFERALINGPLKQVRSLALEDKDVILEIRDNEIHLYCKGNLLFQVTQEREGGYCVEPNDYFSRNPTFHVDSSVEELEEFLTKELPFMKDRIAKHGVHGREIEFEQAIVRACNFERANSDYLIIDRQIAMPLRNGQIDLLGIFWEDHSIKKALPALIEVKYRQQGGVADIAEQVNGYYEYIKKNFSAMKENLQALLQQKARLGLFPGLQPEAQDNLKDVEISGEVNQVKIVVVLVDYSPRADNRYIDRLGALKFADQIRVLKLGFTMWDKYGHPVLPKSPPTAAG